MDTLLILGGTAWLGRELARQAVDAGTAVTCLARGDSGPVADGATLVATDRSRPGAYDAARGTSWDAVIDVSWQPDFVRSATDALADVAARWIYVSSASVYADETTPGADEDAELLPPLMSGSGSTEHYGEAKVGCESLVTDALDDRALLARVGLIAGPGDPSDRFGYWVSRFALAREDHVLVPDAPGLWSQAVDVRDVAGFLLACADRHESGPVNVVGESRTFAEVIDASAVAADFMGTRVSVSPEWLVRHGVQPWAGPRSLPLWLPLPEYAGFGSRSDVRALALGLHRRSLEASLADVLADERMRGLDRPRRAGLSRAEESALLAKVREP
jgi:nucleoside-diphosphate-sugar epimerase